MSTARGVVLPLVLMGLLVIGAVTFALSFRVTLDSMAARSSLSAALAQAQAAGALSLAVAERVEASSVGAALPPAHGPWPQYGVAATVSVAPAGILSPTGILSPAGSPASYELETLTATAVVGRATAVAAVTVYFAPEPVVLWRR